MESIPLKGFLSFFISFLGFYFEIIFYYFIDLFYFFSTIYPCYTLLHIPHLLPPITTLLSVSMSSFSLFFSFVLTPSTPSSAAPWVGNEAPGEQVARALLKTSIYVLLLITMGHIPPRYVSREYKWLMLFIPASLFKSLEHFTLCSSRASWLLLRFHVAFSHHFLGSAGSCRRLVPCSPCVSTVPPSLVWGSKLSVHSCWKVTLEASFSSFLVTGILLLTLCTLLFLLCWNSYHEMEIFIQGPNLSQVELILKKQKQGRSSTIAVELHEHRGRWGDIPASLHIGWAHPSRLLSWCLLPNSPLPF